MAEFSVPIGVSNRHLHVSREDLDTLFGEGHELTVKKDLSQKGQYAAEECVDIVGPKATIKNVRILGPCRKATQVEVSRTDCYVLGVNPPVRDSGDLTGTPGIKLVGPKGEVHLTSGCICAKRHVHMNHEDAARLGVSDKEIITVKVPGDREIVFGEVLARVHETFTWEMHMDTDEANAAGVKSGDCALIIR